MTEIIMFLVAAVVGAGILQNRWNQAKADEQREADVWDQAARKLDGEVGDHSMRCELDGVRTRFRREQHHGGSTPRYHVELEAGPLLGIPNVRMRASGRSLLGSIADKALHREVDVGDTTFSEKISVTGRPAPVVRAFFDRLTRLRVEEMGLAFRIEDDTLYLDLEGRPQEVAPLLALARYAEVLIMRWNKLATTPLALGEALDLEPIDFFEREGVQVMAKGLRRGQEIELGVKWSDDDVHIVVFVGAERIERDGLAQDPHALASAVDAFLDRGGAYR